MGPVVSERPARARDPGFVDRARNAGDQVLTGGEAIDRAGFWYKPTVVTDVAQDSEIVQNEVFGPVVTVQRFDDEDDGARLGQRRRLRPRVVGLDARRRPGAADVAQAPVRHRVDQHAHPAHPEMPHGGYKQSGYGKDMSIYSIEEYTNVKHVMASLD